MRESFCKPRFRWAERNRWLQCALWRNRVKQLLGERGNDRMYGSRISPIYPGLHQISGFSCDSGRGLRCHRFKSTKMNLKQWQVVDKVAPSTEIVQRLRNRPMEVGHPDSKLLFPISGSQFPTAHFACAGHSVTSPLLALGVPIETTCYRRLPMRNSFEVYLLSI